MPRKGRARKKKRTHIGDEETAQSALASNDNPVKIPKSLVIRRGKCEPIVGELVQNIRQLMMPYTAISFQEDAKNRKLTLEKYCQHAALPLGVTHILCFSQNDERLYLRIAKTPSGPTLSFRIHQFSLIKHVQQLQKHPMTLSSLLTQNSPIVVTNNFGDRTMNTPPQVKLMRITFQNMFPAVNVATVKLSKVKRVVLFHLIESDDDDDNDDNNDNDENNGDNQEKPSKKQIIEVRQYAIKLTPVGINRKVRRVIQTKLPNLHNVQDIADYIIGNNSNNNNNSNSSVAGTDYGSDSEPEDAKNSIVETQLNQQSTSPSSSLNKSALKLVELGPRLSMELYKVQQGFGGPSDQVMFHQHITKTPQEIQALQEKHESAAELKRQRRLQQEQNVERKRKLKEEKLQAKKLRRQEREQQVLNELRQEKALQEQQNNQDSDDDDNDNDESDDNDSNAESDSE